LALNISGVWLLLTQTEYTPEDFTIEEFIQFQKKLSLADIGPKLKDQFQVQIDDSSRRNNLYVDTEVNILKKEIDDLSKKLQSLFHVLVDVQNKIDQMDNPTQITKLENSRRM